MSLFKIGELVDLMARQLQRLPRSTGSERG